ncbi:MAG TPA: MBL fold metallo-hydrolase [Candidatus Eisenbacteria bacterium]|nr:MBL fold metallo-hydrolase [Candidatus Eisenbacteria bacterium]
MGLESRSFVLGPFGTNAYLVTCEDTRETAVIDVGFEPEVVLDVVRREGLKVRYLLNTHAHYDHVAMMAEVQRQVGGTYWLHPDDRFLLKGLAQQGAAFGLPPQRPPEDIHDLLDGQEMELGKQKIGVIHTPGHSPGSVTFRWNQWLWVGDVLFAGSIGRTDLPGGSLDQLTTSIRHRLFPLGDDLRVLPGHGPETTLGIERRMNPFVGDGVGLA